MPHIGLLFEIRRAETRPGESVSIVGGCPELNNWDPFDPSGGLQLRTGGSQYPCWAMSAPVWIELGSGASPGFRECVEDETRTGWEAEAEAYDDWDPPDHDTSAPGTPDLHAAFAATNFAEGGGTLLRLEYKYLKDRRQVPDAVGPSIQWEDCIANRRVVLPQEHGSMWIVSDSRFNDHSDPLVTRTTLAEVLARRGDLDPAWTSRPRISDPEAHESAIAHFEELSSPASMATTCSRHTTSTIWSW